MNGFEEFIRLFGEITVKDIVVVIVIAVFLYKIYKRIEKFINNKIEEQNKRAEAEKKRDAELQEALTSVRKYPEYREQSLKIQALLESEIQELRDSQKDTTDRLERIEESNKKRTRSARKDRLLQAYRYYMNKETNPTHSWTSIEAEAFWDLFADYEEAGGNGYMHTTVQPAMESLTVIDI